MPDTLIPLLERLGIPLVMLIAIGWGVYRSGRWLGSLAKDYLVPRSNELVANHLAFTKSVSNALNQLTELQRLQTEELRALKDLHVHPASPVSTVRTNKAVVLLADMIMNLAKAQGIDLSDTFSRISQELVDTGTQVSAIILPGQPQERS